MDEGDFLMDTVPDRLTSIVKDLMEKQDFVNAKTARTCHCAIEDFELFSQGLQVITKGTLYSSFIILWESKALNNVQIMNNKIYC